MTRVLRPVPCRSPSLHAAVVLALVLASPAITAAQVPEGTYRISQRATVTQTLGDALISLDYSRPLARDRTDLFGKVVHWGELWTPGANEATVLEVSKEVKLNGHDVPAGRWSMWIIPSQVGPWELVLDARDTLFHTQRPELTEDQIRFVVDVEEGSVHEEALMWAFPRIAQDGATMLMSWGTTRIPIEVEVEPITPVLTISAEDAALYVGEWQAAFAPDPETGAGAPPTVLTLRHTDDGHLFAGFPEGALPGPPPVAAVEDEDMSPQERERAAARRALAEMETSAWDFLLVPRARGIFMLGFFHEGVLLDVEEFYHEFEFDGGRAVRLTVRSAEDRVFLTATRAME